MAKVLPCPGPRPSPLFLQRPERLLCAQCHWGRGMERAWLSPTCTLLWGQGLAVGVVAVHCPYTPCMMHAQHPPALGTSDMQSRAGRTPALQEAVLQLWLVAIATVHDHCWEAPPCPQGPARGPLAPGLPAADVLLQQPTKGGARDASLQHWAASPAWQELICMEWGTWEGASLCRLLLERVTLQQLFVQEGRCQEAGCYLCFPTAMYSALG